MGRKCAIYGRVSTSGQSNDLQIQECRSYAERCGYHIVGEYTDTISGVTSQDDREGLSRLLEDAFKKRFDVVVVYSIDRVGRSLKSCLETLDTLKEYKCDFVSIKQNLDTSSATGQLMFNIFACLAGYERTMILERTALGRQRAMKNGVKFGRRASVTEATVSSVKTLHEKGCSTREIMRQLNVSYGTAYRASKVPLVAV